MRVKIPSCLTIFEAANGLLSENVVLCSKRFFFFAACVLVHILLYVREQKIQILKILGSLSFSMVLQFQAEDHRLKQKRIVTIQIRSETISKWKKNNSLGRQFENTEAERKNQRENEMHQFKKFQCQNE